MVSKIKVLHVAESFGGGVATALAQYASSTPDIEHHLLRTVRQGDYVDGGEMASFTSIRELPRGPLKARRAIKESVRTIQPSVVHAHSSFGGAYVRASVRATQAMPVVYTPHGYAFERNDISKLYGLFYQSIERLLSRNTSVYAACSPREASLSSFRGFKGRVVYLPNVAEPAHISVDLNDRTAGELLVVSVGRLAPQRDPLYFAEVVRLVRKVDPRVRFCWVGGGGTEYLEALQEVGVEITGWLSRDEARQLLGQADLHVHTAAWDGFPMVLLEANMSRVPSLVRSVAPFAEVPDDVRCGTPEEMAQRILAMRETENREEALARWDEFLSENTMATQRERLMSIYQPAS